MTAQPTPLADAPFLRACRRQPVPYTPVWYMRQAGRSPPEYRRARAGTPMLKARSIPDVITEVTLQPLRRYPVMLPSFSDIVFPPHAIGVGIDIKPGAGPVLADPVRAYLDVPRLRNLEPGDAPFITEAVTALVASSGRRP